MDPNLFDYHFLQSSSERSADLVPVNFFRDIFSSASKSEMSNDSEVKLLLFMLFFPFLLLFWFFFLA